MTQTVTPAVILVEPLVAGLVINIPAILLGSQKGEGVILGCPPTDRE